jgi:Domain of unknown function (DUF4157)
VKPRAFLANEFDMALRNKIHSIERAGVAQRTPHRTARAAPEQRRFLNPAVAWQRATGLNSAALGPADILALQRSAGNRAVQRMLAAKTGQSTRRRLTIQAKLAVGPANDAYEREADRVAATVMQTTGPSTSQIQRRPAQEEDQGKSIQTKPLASSITPLVQRQETAEREDDKETPVQRQSPAAHSSVVSNVEQDIERARGSVRPLPGDLRLRMEQSFGADFSGVRVHADADSDRLNRSLQARAFTTGTDLFFRGGEYSPNSRQGQQLIAHELTHVVQQGGGNSGANGPSVQRAGGQVVQRVFDEARGIFHADPTGLYGNIVDENDEERRRENYNRDTGADLFRYSVPVTGGISSTTKVLTNYGTLVHEGRNLIHDTVPAISATGQALSVLGGAGGGLGAAASVMNAVEGFQQARSSTATTGQSRLGFGRGVSGLTSATQQAATSAHHIGNLTQSALASTAQVVSGGAALATGTVDILRGYYAMHRADQNIERLKKLRRRSRNVEIQEAARQAQSTQDIRRSTGKWTIGKGVLLAAGGGLLAASLATPIGWVLLAGAALTGLISLALKFFRKRQRKVDVAMRALQVTQEQMDAWKRNVNGIESVTWWGSARRRQMLERLGPDPLEKKLKENGFRSAGHFYANYINYTANKMYDEGIDGRRRLELQIDLTSGAPPLKEANRRRMLAIESIATRPDLAMSESTPEARKRMDYQQLRHHFGVKAVGDNLYPQVEELLAGMGLKFDFRKDPPEPKPEKIGKALHE